MNQATNGGNLPASQSNVAITKQLLDSVPSVRDIFDIPEARTACIGMYEKLNNKGHEHAVMRFEAEKAMILQQMPKLEKCSRISILNSTLELLMSGLTLRDGMSYIVPMGSTATFMPGWKGRLEQLQEMPNIIMVHAPQVVYDCDTFVYSKPGGKYKIKDHEEGQRTATSQIVKVYLVITFGHGVGDVVYMMDRIDVLNIRDRRSASWKQHVKDAPRVQPNGKIWIQQGQGDGNGFWKDYEAPMWVTDEAQAFKKTLVKRVYNEMPNKLPKHKYIDDNIATNKAKGGAEHEEQEIDLEEQSGGGYDSYEDITNHFNDLGMETPPAEKVSGPANPSDTSAY